MKGRFRKHSLAGQKRLGQSFRDVNGPPVVLVIVPGKSNDETSVGDALHERENPLREETSTGPPVIAPA
jgi:hypothetical protein